MDQSLLLQYWNYLPPEQKQMFESYTYKEGSTMSSIEWFDHLVPDILKDNPQEVEAWMNGDSTLAMPDRDNSRLDHSEGYSADNTVMEDMSINRARGGETMSSSDYEAATEAYTTDAQVIDAHFTGDITPEQLEALATTSGVATAEATTAELVATSTEPALAETVGQVVSDALIPTLVAAKVGLTVADQFETTKDKLGYGSLASGGTVALFVNPVTGPLCWTGVAVYTGINLAKLGLNLYANHRRRQRKMIRVN